MGQMWNICPFPVGYECLQGEALAFVIRNYVIGKDDNIHHQFLIIAHC